MNHRRRSIPAADADTHFARLKKLIASGDLSAGGKLLPFQAPGKQPPDVLRVVVPPVIDQSKVEEIALPRKTDDEDEGDGDKVQKVLAAQAKLADTLNEIVRVIKAGSGLMVGCWIPDEVAKMVALKGEGCEVAEDLHITLAYIGSLGDLPEDTPQIVEQVVRGTCEGESPLKVKLAGIGRFAASKSSDAMDVFHLNVDAPGLAELRNRIVTGLRMRNVPVSEDHGFSPHVTLKYMKPGEPLPMDRLEPIEFTLDAVTVAAGSDRAVVPLTRAISKKLRQKVPPERGPEAIQAEAQTTEKREHPAGYIAESEQINRNKETVGSGPHKFKAAEWTHPNGHPRCILCGDEEREGGTCDGAGVSKAIAKAEGDMDFKDGDEGDGIFQVHERGLSELQTKVAPVFGWEPVSLSPAQVAALSKLVGKDVGPALKSAQEGDSSALGAMLDPFNDHKSAKALSAAEQKLVALATPVSIHTDFRLHRKGDDYWEGGEGFTPGNQHAANKILALQDGDEGKVLMGFKAVGSDIIRGPLSWLKVGEGSPKVFPPGAVGSTANAWSRFRIHEKFKWIAGAQDEHFKEFWILGSPISGRWIIQSVPIGTRRSWLLSRPKDQTPQSERLRATLEDQGIEVTKAIWCPIIKVDNERRLITGIVLQPEVVDAQGDIISAEVIEEAAHEFLANYNNKTQLGVQHKSFNVPVSLRESWVSPVDFKLGPKAIRKGTWMMTVKAEGDDLWGKVKSGEIRGFSIGGVAKVKRVSF